MVFGVMTRLPILDFQNNAAKVEWIFNPVTVRMKVLDLAIFRN